MPRKTKPTLFELRQLRSIADLQFGKGAGEILFPDNILVEHSKATKRIRYIYLGDKRLCSYRVTDGFLVPSLLAGEILHKNNLGAKVVAHLDAEPFIKKGKSLFAKHVIEVDDGISAKDEVLIVNNQGKLLGIGTAKLPTLLMKEMKRGVAVDTRKGKE